MVRHLHKTPIGQYSDEITIFLEIKLESYKDELISSQLCGF